MIDVTRRERAVTSGVVTSPVMADDELLARADAAWAAAGRAQLALLESIREVGRREAWRADGASHLAHWVSMRYGVSVWKAERWVLAADALQALPRIAGAMTSGELGLDKVVELTRFARPETEGQLVAWARDRASGAIRARADLERRRQRSETVAAEHECFVRMGYTDDGMRFELAAELPADQGAVVATALSRLADRVPAVPAEARGANFAEARRADALVMLCSGTIAADPDADRATLVVHAALDSLLGGPDAPNAEVHGGPVLAPEVAQRLACDSRIEVVVHDRNGDPFRLGRLTRTPSPSLMRELRRRDRTCRFPGCPRRRFTNAHHVVWWSRGGRTDLANLVLLCGFHHRLVHERGWNLALERGGDVRWFRPGGQRYRAGPARPAAP
jgi:Domain of unknown function (DUF222)/HNH endonuclease